MKMKKILLVTLLLWISNANAEWIGARTIVAVDSLNVDGAYITLSGYQNAACDGNRVYLLHQANVDNYKEMFAMVISAFHANAQVDMFIDPSCRADRVVLTK